MEAAPAIRSLVERVAALDWARIEAELDAFGAASTGPVLSSSSTSIRLRSLLSTAAGNRAARNRVVGSPIGRPVSVRWGPGRSAPRSPASSRP